ncbi:methyltransferase domain-containing protein [Deinococcus radiophilus]|uniref:Methyltransferase domain-containing protein n=3 Tax=Deinococcus radiophilus TaxID=32062 RepID=A0A3S0KIX4_9DEIO|nr:methyltransferase domain-containing protein [Deinococcus radiophilus]RTR27757.1 methyltransferase domain-containing protein [Deinococcus radiophilus]UFA51430.1 methyltransferase domain-containing protein [Deinococcus radiophilus]
MPLMPPRRPSSRSKSRPRRSAPRGNPAEWPLYAAEVLRGLEEVARTELSAIAGLDVLSAADEEIRFRYAGATERLSRLRSVVAVYAVRQWDVPRPRGLLGHQQLGELTSWLRGVAEQGGHRSFRLSAAGRETEVMERLSAEVGQALGLPEHPEEGELRLRLRPAPGGTGWEGLARLTPRPLSAREWRVCNREGGLNAATAYAALALAGLRVKDRIFNPMCGSGTLLVERALMGPYEAMVGVDIDPEAVACARANLKAAGRSVEVAQVDALNTGLPPRTFDLIVADLPWGDDIGTHGGNAEMYPAFLREMHRLCSKGGRMVVVTHELRLFERVAQESPWEVRELTQVYSGGHHPKIYLLTR